MGLYTDSINTSVAFKVNEAQRDTDRNLRRLSTGDRILRPEDDAGALQVAMKMDSSRKRSDAALLGLQNARSYTEAQDQALDVVGQLFTRLSELATLATDATKNSSDRNGYNYEFQNLVQEIQRIDLQEFNDIRLFRGKSYKVIETPTRLTWSEAQQAVKQVSDEDPQNTHYLATVTSQAEQDEINRQIANYTGNALWLGGSDQVVEGEWRWVEGPEGLEDGGQGRLFWVAGVNSRGDVGEIGTNGSYLNWNGGEPNDSGASEDALQMLKSSGLWNDLPKDSTTLPGYLRETDQDDLAVSYHEDGDTFDLTNISYTSGQEGDVLYLPNELFSSMNVKTVADAVRAVELITGKNQQPETDEDRFSALSVIARLRAQVGANLSRLGSEIEHLTRKRDNFEAAHSRTADLDVALESTRFQRNSAKLEFGAAMLAQANGLSLQTSVMNFI